jgi:ketosteroid isomerase-like protein
MSESNKEKVQAMFDAMAIGDFELMKTYLHPDVFVTEAECLPYPGVHHGPDAYIRLVHKVVATWDDLQLSVNAMVEDGDMVMVVSEFAGKNKAGVAFKMPMTEVFYFTNGKISEVRPYYFDTNKLAELHAQQDG